MAYNRRGHDLKKIPAQWSSEKYQEQLYKMLGKNVERFSKNWGIIHQNGHNNTLKEPPARFEMIKQEVLV